MNLTDLNQRIDSINQYQVELRAKMKYLESSLKDSLTALENRGIDLGDTSDLAALEKRLIQLQQDNNNRIEQLVESRSRIVEAYEAGDYNTARSLLSGAPQGGVHRQVQGPQAASQAASQAVQQPRTSGTVPAQSVIDNLADSSTSSLDEILGGF